MITLRKISETTSKITLGWDPVPGCIGYVFYADDQRVSNTWDPNKSQVTFSKGPDEYKVVALGVEDQGAYPPAAPPPGPKAIPFRPRGLLTAADPLNPANYRDVVTGQPFKAIDVPDALSTLSQLAAAQHGSFDNNTSYFLKPFKIAKDASASSRSFGIQINCGRDVVSIKSDVRVPSVTTSDAGNANDPGAWLYDGGADDGEIHVEGRVLKSVNGDTIRTHRKIHRAFWNTTVTAYQFVYGPHSDISQTWGTSSSQIPCRGIKDWYGTGYTDYTGLVNLVEAVPAPAADPVSWFRDKIDLHPFTKPNGNKDASNMAYMCSGPTGQAGGPYTDYTGNVWIELPTGGGGAYVRGIDDIVCLRYIATPLSVFAYEIKSPNGTVLFRSVDAPTGGSGRPEAKVVGNYLTFDRTPDFNGHKFIVGKPSSVDGATNGEFVPEATTGLNYQPVGYTT